MQLQFRLDIIQGTKDRKSLEGWLVVRVVNKKKDPYDVYIGRGSKWGNPYAIGVDGDRETVIEKFRIYLWASIRRGDITIQDLLELDGKTLGCFCKPAACHGDVLVRAVAWAKTRFNSLADTP